MKYLFATLLSVYLVTSFAQTPQFYRYKDENGSYIISNTLPPEAAALGYDIVTSRGNVIEHIAPKKSAADLAKEAELEKQKEIEKKLSEEKAQQALVQSRKDEVLLKLFSCKEDIIRSRDEKISSIEVLVSITKENINRQINVLKDAKKKMLELQQTGQPLPPHLQNLLNDTRENIKESKAFLKQKKLEIVDVHNQYQSQIERFEYLMEQKKHIEQ
ncbi:hypothetical protein CC99x_000870 [Candidatus Berkiella cookevillensis]|uniref:DUF4124 domain-containing protein n=1 Tax=Candidatus Berkiella cookevillensis TaxID=437022 RepID=A0A0Q9YFU8_9GAMM|nr:hypothetical protein [Candidatus Berkiella cookevillensis]MCS5707447.1 hypothetical protein [Candidatus Berkiella cookevillensis]